MMLFSHTHTLVARRIASNLCASVVHVRGNG